MIQINGQVDFTEDQLAIARHGCDGRILAGEEGDGVVPVAEQCLPVGIEGGESLWGLGIDNANPELAKAVQAALQELMDDGTYLELLKAWNVDGMAIDEATINGGA